MGKGPGGMASGGLAPYTPNIFNYGDHYDRELTPRKGWQQQVGRLDALLDQGREERRQLEMKGMEDKQSLERQTIELHSKFTEEQ